MLEGFIELRKEVSEIIDDFLKLTTKRERDHSTSNLQEILKKLEENRFYLVVLGQFKRGKSTFINSLLGDTVLPTSVIPLTSVLTFISYGSTEKIKVMFQDNSIKDINRDQLIDYVTEKGNPKNKKNVKHVEISFPSAHLRDGIYIIDTPGVGSVFENNTDTTYGFLPKVDAALFLLAADPPISQSEITFLHDVRQYVEKIFFLQNKIDYLSHEERNESLHFTKSVLEQALGSNTFHLIPISAKLALEGRLKNEPALLNQSGVPEFESLLTEFLTKAKGKTVLMNSIRQSSKLIADEQLVLDLEYKACTTPLEVLEKKIALFKQKMEEVRQDREDVKYYFEGEIQRVIDVLDRDLDRFKQKELPKVTEQLDKLSGENLDKPIGDYIQLLEKGFHDCLIKGFDAFVRKEEERLNEEYSRISKRFSEKTNEMIDIIVKASSEIFEINLDLVKTDERITDESSLYYLIGEAPKFFDIEGVFDYFSKRILPTKLSKGIALKDIKKRLSEEFDKNCGRIRWDFMNRIKKSFLDFRWELNKKIDMTEENIRTAIEKAVEMRQKSAEELNSFKVDMEKDMESLSLIKERITRIEEKVRSL